MTDHRSCLLLASSVDVFTHSNHKPILPSFGHHSLALPTFRVTFKNLLSHPCPIHCNHMIPYLPKLLLLISDNSSAVTCSFLRFQFSWPLAHFRHISKNMCPCLTKRHVLKTNGGNWYTAPHILNLCYKWRWEVSFTPISLYHSVRAPHNHWTWDWVGPKASSMLWTEVPWTCQESKLYS
jgi:hypothetical protein